MAPYQSQPVKSLNESSGGKRFVFKNFEQRVGEIEIDVFRNLEHLKTEPSGGSSFFRESLLYWRELNTAEDFISFYEEMMPCVQTLPQILLYKDTIISKLLCRLKMQAALSLEPILRLIASLSRDLLEDFLPFLQKIADSLVNLLKNGGDREPEILEQVFTSWSYIMMHLQKYLTQNIANVMKVTVRLRYYPKHYVQEFMAEAVAFLLRNAPVQQLIKGVRKVIHEAVKKPLSPRKYGVSALLWHVMRGTSSKFHSRAKEVLRLLMDKFIMHSGDDFSQGSDTIIEVISVALERACEELSAEELTLILDCSLEQMFDCVDNRDLLHLSRLLSFIVPLVKYSKGKKISDLKPILEFVESLIQRYVMASCTEVEGYCDELLDRVLQLMLHLLDIPRISNDLTLMSSIVQQWEPVFLLRNLRLLTFMKALLGKDASVLYALRGPIVSAMDDLMETSSEEVIYLMLIFFEKLQGKLHSSIISNSHGISDVKVLRILSFFQGILSHWIRRITELASDGTLSDISIHKSDLAVLWGVLFCYPYFCSSQADSSLIVKLIDALDQLLLIESEKIGGIEKPAWQSLVGAALASYQKVLCCTSADLSEINCFVSHATSYKSSQQVLCAVAEFLDSTLRSTSSNGSKPTLHPELDVIKRDNAVHIFAENLGAPNKEIRISTLRILCHFEPLDHDLDLTVDHVAKKLKTEGSQQDIQCCNVIQLLHSIEVTPLSIFASRQADILISRIERGLSAARISKTDISMTLYGILGIIHNRFAQLWDPALKCLTTLLGNYVGLIWEIFIQYLEKCQNNFEASCDQVETLSLEYPNNLNDLTKKFNSFLSPPSDSTPSSTIIILLLQSLQREKVPSIVQTRSRQLLPLFFKFMGYTSGDISSVSHFNPHACKGKEWRLVLKEWLNLLKLMRNPKSLYQSCALKEILIYRLLDDMDADVQLKVLDCLLTWKDDFLLPYEQNLRNLITSKNLREELTTWTLSRDSNHVQEEHRGHLIPLVIRVLIPKIRNLKMLASRKHAGVQHRRAVLCFLQQLDLDELPLFFSLLLKPLNPVAHVLEDFEKQRWSSCDAFVSEFLRSNFVENFSIENINSLSWKKRSGFLHVTEDILSTFDGFHIIPFLNLLMLFVVRMLESCTISLVRAKCSGPSVAENHSTGDAEETIAGADKFKKNNALKQLKDLRSLCLKIISFVLHKYDLHDFGTQFWDSFFMSVKPLVDSFKQEGSSSEKPSSLFSCFLAMSRSSNLVSLLAREEHLVSSIFSILTVKTASNAIVASVLSFIENLLYLDSDIDSHEDSGIKRVLLPNLEALIFNLHCLFTCRKGENRKSVTWPRKTELKIFLLLSKYIKKPLDARYFTDIMLPFLAKKGLSKEECIDGLHVIQGILPVVGLEAVGKILAALAPLLVFAELDIRLCVCDILDGLAVKKPSLDFLARLLRSLNAVSTEEIGEFDYDARVNAYEKITPELFSMLEEDSALVILSHCIYDMSSEELILRQSASKSLLSFVKFSAVLLGPNEASQQDMLSNDRICENGQPETDVGWARTSILRIVNKFLLKHVGDAMTKAVSVQKEWLALLRCMILNLPTVPTLNSFKPLCSDDAEIDFFNNILHLQKHRRAKALSRFRNVVSAGNLSETVTTKIFVPLFFNMLFEVKDGKGEHVRDACLDSLASVSCIMQWETYHLFLIRCFREIRLKPDKEKILVRLICSILDKFHFSQGQKDTGHSDDSSHDAPIVPHIIQTTLQKSVLPEVQKLLSSESEKVNANISVAALKLLKLLPQDVMESQLPSIIQRISNFLKNRLESVRDDARSALAACVIELGPAYLHFIVKVLKSSLRRGYELHVLGYTLNFILSKMATDFLPGKLDYCLEEILAVAENDILGDVAEEKEVEKIASKMKETRKSKSFDTLKLMAQSITFKTHAVKLLSPVKSCLDKHLTQKVKTKADSMLHHIALGIECNSSVDPTDLFVFTYGLIEDGINGENSQSSHLITVFALGVLNNRLKSMKLNKKDDQLLSLLDPLVGLLGNCLKSKYEDIVSTALKCFTPLMKLPLPSLRYQAKDIKNFLLDFTQRSENASNPLTHTCLKLLTVLLQSDKVSISDGQLKDLVQFLSVEIENDSAQVVLSLLKAIVGRRLVINEIYDLVKRVGELMVRSQSEPIRKKCSQILLQFLLDYPLHNKRLQQHLDFLLENLSYVHPSGREAVLEMVHAVLKKFPKEVLTVHASNFFFKLILCLANENDNEVCMMVGAAIKLLIERISKQALHVIIDASLIWYSSEKPKSWSTGAQALGLLVEVLKKGFQNYVDDILQVACRVLASAAHIAADNTKEISDEDKIPLWKESYYTFIMLEKILLQFQDLFFEKNLEGIWDLVCKFLLHPHMRLRNISSQLVAMYFAEVSNAKSNRENLNLEMCYLMEPSKLFPIAVSFCCQLRSKLLEEMHANLITQNLAFAFCGIHTFLSQINGKTPLEFWSMLGLSERDSFLKAFEALGSRRGTETFFLCVSGDQIAQDGTENLQSLLARPLLKKMGKVALQMDNIQMRVVFNCFRIISLQIGPEGSSGYGMQLLDPLYRVCEGFAGKEVSDETKQLAAEVRDSIRGVMGVEAFVQIYNQIRKSLKGKRDRRKQQIKRMTVINPMRHAKRKLRIAEKHRANKRRKIVKMKERRR